MTKEYGWVLCSRECKLDKWIDNVILYNGDKELAMRDMCEELVKDVDSYEVTGFKTEDEALNSHNQAFDMTVYRDNNLVHFCGTFIEEYEVDEDGDFSRTTDFKPTFTEDELMEMLNFLTEERDRR